MARIDCKLCGRDDKLRIEEIALQQGPRAAGRAAGISHNAVMRHMARHVSAQPETEPSPEETPLEGATESDAVLESVQDTSPLPDLHPVESHTPAEATPPATPEETKTLAVVVANNKHKERFPHVAALATDIERRRYLHDLFRLGRFDGLRTAGLLSLIWDDLGPIEFAELVSRAAIEINFRRGSEQARRVVLLGKVERLFQMAVDAKDLKTAARLLETWARLDVPVGVDMLTALASTTAWPLVAKELQAKHPEAFDTVYGALVAEEARRRQVAAPALVESDHVAG
jgi:hypothetical protein